MHGARNHGFLEPTWRHSAISQNLDAAVLGGSSFHKTRLERERERYVEEKDRARALVGHAQSADQTSSEIQRGGKGAK